MEPGNRFELIDPPLVAEMSPAMDNGSEENIAALKRSGDLYAAQNEAQLTRIARRLLKI